MDFTSFASSSRGNLYRLSNGESALLIEAGLPLKEIKKALDFKLSGISGCLISHSHQDHSKATRDLMKAGVDVYCTRGTANALSLDGHRLNVIKPLVQFNVGLWSVLPFNTVHDADEPVGFLIAHKHGGKLLFATDTAYVRYKFKGLTIIAIECNYSRQLIMESVCNREVNPELAKRVRHNHMSFESVQAFLNVNDLSLVQEIHLLHASDTSSSVDFFKSEIQKQTGKPVYISGGLP